MADCAKEVQFQVGEAVARRAHSERTAVAFLVALSHIADDMRLVLDTSVVIAGFRSPRGASAELLRYGIGRKVTFLMSVNLFLEYEAVLKRPEHLAAAGLSAVEIEEALDEMAVFVEPIETHFMWRPRLRDPNDDMILELAANGRADAIVTFNVRDFEATTSQFGIPVMVPGAALRRLRNEKW